MSEQTPASRLRQQAEASLVPPRVRRDTRNPFRLGYAHVRYTVGLAVADLLKSQRGRFPRLYRWAHTSEARQNCIIDPWLGRACRLSERLEHASRELRRVGEQLRDLPHDDPGRDALRRRHRRWEAKAVDLSYQRARHQLLAYPDDLSAQATVDLHERLSKPRA